MNDQRPTALVTGASRGLGRALTRELAGRGWHVIANARRPGPLAELVASADPGSITTVAGDVADPAGRERLHAAVAAAGGLDLLVNNASTLGPSPLPALAEYPPPAFEHVLAVNVVAPLALTQMLLPRLEARGGTIVNVSSDAAVEAYSGWGGYGSAKAALDQLTAVLAAEHPLLHVYAVDPGDMATDMHQAAYPGEDISDRPLPETVVPALLRLIAADLPSGRYRAADLARAPVR